MGRADGRSLVRRAGHEKGAQLGGDMAGRPLALHEGCSQQLTSSGTRNAGQSQKEWVSFSWRGCIRGPVTLTGVRNGQTVALGGAEADGIDLCPPASLGECAHWAPTLRQPDTSRSAGQLSEQSRCPRHGCSPRGPTCPSCPGPVSLCCQPGSSVGLTPDALSLGVSGVGRFFCHFCKNQALNRA